MQTRGPLGRAHTLHSLHLAMFALRPDGIRRSLLLLGTLGLAVVLGACRAAPSGPPGPPSTGAIEGCRGPGDPSGLVFEDASERAGLPMTGIAHCTVVSDLDRDGHEDLLFAQGESVQVLWGHGDFTFTPQEAARLYLSPVGCLAADFDGNGLRDLVLNAPTPVLVTQDAPRQFSTELRTLAGPIDYEYTGALAAGDFDGDGWIDLYVAREKPATESGLDCVRTEDDLQCHLTTPVAPSPDLLFKSAGGTLTGVAPSLLGALGIGLGSGTVDLNGDGVVDLVVANDYQRNEVYLSGEGGAMTESAEALGVGAYNHGMGVAVADFNLDGRWDLYITDLGPDGVFFGNASGTFDNAVRLSGAGAALADRWAWGVAAEDLDNDQDVDLFVGVSYRARTGELEAALEDFLGSGNLEASAAYAAQEQGDDLGENCGGGRFQFGTLPVAVANPRRRLPNGVAAGDIDGDGRVDLFVRGDRSLQFGGRPRLWRNVSQSGGRFLSVVLQGSGGNTDAIGAAVRLTAGNTVQLRQVMVASAGGHSSPRLHFGLGEAVSADLEVTWPGGGKTSVSGAVAGEVIQIVQGVQP